MRHSIVALSMLVVAGTAVAVEPTQRTLTFEDRVKAQEAIERVYYSHQIGATKTFEQAVPRAVLESKVHKYLDETAALKVYWKTALTDEMLQRELERMAAGTRMPERLLELYAALGNDPFLIKECLARSALVDRLTHNFYAFDETVHEEARRQADEIHRQLVSGQSSPTKDHPNRTVIELAEVTTETCPPSSERCVQERLRPDEIHTRRADFPVHVGQVEDVTETSEAFAVDVLLRETTTDLHVARYVVPKTTWDAWWAKTRGELRGDPVTAVASGISDVPMPQAANDTCAVEDTWDDGNLGAIGPRSNHTAVWTGSQMIVWGGSSNGVVVNSGARYDPATDTWAAISSNGAPFVHWPTVVWTGTQMLIWDGAAPDSGARYDPTTDRWSPISAIGAPSSRNNHTTVWAGNVMVVWGGSDLNTNANVNTGGRYDPATDHWLPV